MILQKADLGKKVRGGAFRCPTCGTYYDPTYGGCPGCANKNFKVGYLYLAIGVFLYLLILLPLEAGA